jgi:hypothetical protein
MAVCTAYELNSEAIRIQIPQQGQSNKPPIELTTPARWTQLTKLDDSGAVWDFLQRLEAAGSITAHDISLTAESLGGDQNVEYSGAIEGGYDVIGIKSVAEQLQTIVSKGRLRMAIGSLSFTTGQALLDWLKVTNQPFNATKVSQ